MHLALPGFDGTPALTDEELETFMGFAIARIRDIEPDKGWHEALDINYLGDGEIEISLDKALLDR